MYQSFEGDCIYFDIDKELTKQLKQLCVDTDSTIYMVLLAAYNILLSKYTGQEDIVVSSPQQAEFTVIYKTWLECL
jgi:hypothetical protein